MAGVVGRHKFTYDIWGDAVNVAARLEQNSEAGRINVSQAVFEAVEPLFDLVPRGTLAVKNKSPLAMYFLERAKTDHSHDIDGPRRAWPLRSLGTATPTLRRDPP
jgi:class 3 adenylate cyclase